MNDNSTKQAPITPAGDSLRSHVSASEGIEYSRPSGNIIVRDNLENSVIQIICIQETENKPQWFAALGGKRLTQMHDTSDAAIKELDSRQGQFTLMTAICEDMFHELKRQAELADEKML